ncbi:4-diphosphocytidyl-2-C-methyl-D-erythritol kinase [Stieleria maiorica]|uniref:4-diphosphocytidyl-2-C-methyl-D-erythritol kinase n=1 Tax=Stieleria maiorica TaxID=2795974 RepID=A0A5B9M480_9BACT|nr:4-(cytidine 5'-diphospho)-2-C-methyl-D-erythritol kinase [Stieleria maiorica]QEF96028.1 4-diphosphocytidyl-2-C-methyl-D-erythritol kinase [Stieleria maiorica]
MTVVRTSPPAKLNLFLEIPARRDDGYHEIDTVMVAIDWRDELEIEPIPQGRIELTASWLPSVESIAGELGLDTSDGRVPELLRIPTDGSNLVVRALDAFRATFGVKTGFRVRLGKRIPAGAGMGGASSDAAHAISCAAQIHQIDNSSRVLHEIAASIGSDVPFFLGGGGPESAVAARATGRGERLLPLQICPLIHFVVAYPSVSLSTAGVYAQLNVPQHPVGSASFLQAMDREDRESMGRAMMNRLSEPALKILPQLSELLESLWQCGLQPCQLTGSGSACFGIAKDAEQAKDIVKRLKTELQPGVLLRVARTVPAATPIEIEPS